MNAELVVRAEPGESIADTAARAVELAGLAALPFRLIHNGREVTGTYSDTVTYVVQLWERLGVEQQAQYANGGVWVAYYPDWSGFAIFAAEIDCMRYAVANNTQAVWWPFGADRQEVVR